MRVQTILLSSLASLALAQVPGGPWTLSDGTCPGNQLAQSGDESSGGSQCSTDQWPQWCCPGYAQNGDGCNAPECVIGTSTIPITQSGYLTSAYLAAGTTLGSTQTSKGAAAIITAAPVMMAGAWAGMLLV